MDMKSLVKTNYDWDDIIYINDFDILIMIFIILDMFLTQIMIMIL